MSERHKLTTISVSQENYLAFKRLGSAGDSFNDVVTEVLKKMKLLQHQIEPRGDQPSRNQSDEQLEAKR